MKTISIRNKNIHGDKFSVTVDITDGEREVLSKVIEARSKNELNQSLTNLLALTEQVEADFALVEEGDWTPPEQVTSTAEETKQQQIFQAEAELQNEFYKAKVELEAIELAKTNTKVAEKLATLNSLKSTIK